jgi:hypothetical protein
MSDPVVMICSFASDPDRMSITNESATCDQCSRALRYGADSLAQAKAHYPDAEILFRCIRCAQRMGITLTPEKIAAMRDVTRPVVGRFVDLIPDEAFINALKGGGWQ